MDIATSSYLCEKTQHNWLIDTLNNLKNYICKDLCVDTKGYLLWEYGLWAVGILGSWILMVAENYHNAPVVQQVHSIPARWKMKMF